VRKVDIKFSREEWAQACYEVTLEELEKIVNRNLKVLRDYYSDEQIFTLTCSWLLNVIEKLNKYLENARLQASVDFDAIFKEIVEKQSEGQQ